MKHIVRNLSLLACSAGSVFAAPFLAIGDNAELFLTADASVSYNDNILLAASGPFEEEDVIFTFKPGFDLQYGKGSLLTGNLYGIATLTSYADNDNLNNQLLGVGTRASYDNGQLQLNGNLSFNEIDQPTVDTPATLGRLIERHVTNAGINGEYGFSEKISAGLGFSYGYIDYKAAGYNDEKTYTVPVNIYYELTPKVDLSFGVRYTNTQLNFANGDGADEFDAYYYNIGARGSFTPKLSGSFSVGYNTRDANAGPDDDDSIGADASLAYAYSDKTVFTLTGVRNYSNASSTGNSYENTAITLGASSAIAVDWRVSASLTYRILDYQNISREDDYFEASIGATYVINSHLSASASYVFRDNSSDFAGNEFTNNVFSLSISARY